MVLFDYIPESKVKNLRLYKYSGADHSLISKYLLTPYWNWLVSLFPNYVAPNTITISGLALVFINFITLLYFDSGLQCGTKSKLDFISNSSPGFNQHNPLKTTSLFGNSFGVPKSVSNFESSEMGLIGGRYNPFDWIEKIIHKDDSSSTCLPPIIYLTWGISLFLYQSLDAIDGKQARKTGMAGPLGELFDHGCDALNTTLECLLVSNALNLGRSYWTILSLIATLSNFYLTTWEEYHTGTLFLSAFSGPVEGILMICAIYFITAIMGGAGFWDTGILNISGLDKIEWVRNNQILTNWNLPLNEAFMVFGALGLVGNIAASYSNVAASRRSKSLSPYSALLGLTPLVLQLSLNTLWSFSQDSKIIADPLIFIPFLSYWGLGFAYNVGLLIVAHVTKGDYPYWNVSIVWSAIGLLDSSLPKPLLQSTELSSRITIWVSLAASIVLYGHFCWKVVTTITTELGTACFLVRPPTALGAPGKSPSTSEKSKKGE